MNKNLNVKFDWIFFDVGGVLVEESAIKEWRQEYDTRVLQEMGVQVTVDDIKKCWSEACSQIGSVDLNIFKAFLLDEQLAKQAHKKLKDFAQHETSYVDVVTVRSEAVSVLAELSKKYKLGIIANQSVAMKEKLKNAGVLEFFDVHTVSDEHGFEKPDPRIFEAVFKETGADPARSVMIDDNIERSLIPAKKFDMTTVWYKLEKRDAPAGAVDFTIESLPDLLKIL